MQKRYFVLDIIRGIDIINMIAYHLIWSLINIMGVNIGWYNSVAGIIWQSAIGCTFILLSGFCAALGRNTLRRGITVFAAGLLVTAATLIIMPEERIIFGILTFLGSAMIITALCGKFLNRINPAAGFAVSVIFLVCSWSVNDGTLLFGAVKLPAAMYRNMLTAYFGFLPSSFYSSDYYSLFPWIFLFTAGYFLCGVLKEYNKMHILNGTDSGFLGIIGATGRHSLIIYLLHQPVIIGLIYIIKAII